MLSRTWLLAALCICAASIPRVVFGANYFIAAAGDDRASGKSPAAAWRSIERVNAGVFRAGDRIQFEGTGNFRGNLKLRKQSGAETNALVITSYGGGRAKLLAGAGVGITVESAGGVTISHLVVQGDGPTNNTGYGILFENRLEGFQRLSNLRIENVEAAGFGVFGILISGKEAGYEHVRVADCELHDNLRGGMEIAGRLASESPLYAHTDVVVSRCRAHDNTGDPLYDKNHSGSGMVLYQVDGGVIEDSQAWANGRLCHHGNGGVGIWTCASRRVVIERCESFSNRSGGGDGGGFDLDGGSTECVLQDNYSHDNDGPGLMAYTYAYACHADKDNIVRFNISDGDGRNASRYAGLWVRNDGAGMTGLKVYNNTVRAGHGRKKAAYVDGGGVEAEFCDNIFAGCDEALPLLVEKPGEKLRFVNNVYWADGAPFQVAWGGESYADLASWRAATGQDAAGLCADPGIAEASDSNSAIAVKDWPAVLAAYTPRGSTLRPARATAPASVSKSGSPVRDILGRPLSVASWPFGAICVDQ